MPILLIGLFVKEVKPAGGEIITFKVQLPHGVTYRVQCKTCEYREYTAEGIRYLDFTVKGKDRVSVDFPEVKGRRSVRINERVHSLLASMENPHPEWVVPPKYRLMSTENPFDRAEVWVKIKLTRGGVYEITYDMLRELGIDPGLYPVNTYKMIAMLDTFPTDVDSATVWGREVGIWVDTAGQRILFWGEPMRSYRVYDTTVLFFQHPYTDTSVYFLGLGGSPGKRLEVVRYGPGDPATPLNVYRWEEEKYNIGKKGRVWFGKEMIRLATDPDRAFPDTFTLGDLNESYGAVLLRSGIAASEFSDTALVVLTVNDYFCDSVRLRPATYGTLSCTPVVVKGLNDIVYTVKAIATYQTVYLDYYEIIYNSTGEYSNHGTFFVKDSGRFTLNLRGNRPVFVWDVSDIYSPRIIESYNYNNGTLTINDSAGSSGWAKIYVSNFVRRPISMEIYQPRGLRNLKADYVAIGREKFASTFSSFLDYRRNHLPRFNGTKWEISSGSTVWVNLKDIYDEFGLGNPDPTAIRNFLYHMNLISSGQQPLYVTLVGDGTYDYRGITASYFADQVPPYYPQDLSLSINRELMGASDDYYVDFDGDRYGNVGIGRIPVRSESDLAEYLQKVRDYEALKYDGLWRFRVMFVADDAYAGDSPCETFHTGDVLNLVSPAAPNWMVRNPFLLQEYPFEGLTKPQATKDLVKQINSGYLMVSFFLHGNPLQMAHEKLFGLEDIPKLNTQGREAFVTILSCKVGAYDRLDPAHVLGEEFMLKRNRAIAVLSATTLSYASANASYARAIYLYLRNYGKAPLGYLSLQGKNREFYVLLGEPAIMLALPDSTGVVASEGYPVRGARNTAIGGGKGRFAVFDLSDFDTVTFDCSSVKFYYYHVRPIVFNGPVTSDTVRYWLPLRGRLTEDTNILHERLLIIWWDEWEAWIGDYLVLDVNPVLGTEKPRVEGFYAGDELHNGFRLPVKAKLVFKFYSNEGFDIRTTGKGASPPRIVLDNRTSDVLEAEIVSDTVARAYYYVDYSSDPGIHNVAVSVTSALGIRGYSVWDLNFVEKDLKVRDVLVYPNPYRGGDFYATFKLSQDAEVQIRLYTPTGKLVRSYNVGKINAGFNSIPIALPPLSNGIYVLLVHAFNENGSSKAFTRVLILR